jgi:hypothetical protein
VIRSHVNGALPHTWLGLNRDYIKTESSEPPNNQMQKAGAKVTYQYHQFSPASDLERWARRNRL